LNFLPFVEEGVTLRPGQIKVLETLAAVWDKYDYFLIEAPTGSGKSLLSMTIARAVGSAHILTPKKALQHQYQRDFSDSIALMMGRSNYPCFWNNKDTALEKEATALILDNRSASHLSSTNCGGDYVPCKKRSVLERCGKERECPFVTALTKATEYRIVVHNNTSFMFHAALGNKFDLRDVVIVDECHTLESAVRGMGVKTLSIPHKHIPKDLSMSNLKVFLEEYSAHIVLEEELAACSSFMNSLPKRGSLQVYENEIEVTPLDLGNLASRFVFSFGKKTVMMSGTIYDKATFCRNINLPEDSVFFYSIPSDFPVSQRPIRVPSKLAVDTSHKMFEETKEQLAESVKSVLNTFHDKKGIIHTGSYVMTEWVKALDKRIVVPDRRDMAKQIEAFKTAKTPLVLASPAISEGFDFAGDSARFQILLRVPYPSKADPFVKAKSENNFSWMNYQALVTFGQQIGRIVRSDDDWGYTILLDSRYRKFISDNRSRIPNWILEAVNTS